MVRLRKLHVDIRCLLLPELENISLRLRILVIYGLPRVQKLKSLETLTYVFLLTDLRLVIGLSSSLDIGDRAA